MTTRRRRALRRRTAAGTSRGGFTLLELLVVMVIMVVIVGGMTLGLGAVRRGSLRSAVRRIAGASRYAYVRAVNDHKTLRLAFDFEQNEMRVEERYGQFLLEDPFLERSLAERLERDEEDGSGGDDPWERARQTLDQSQSAQLDRTSFEDITSMLPMTLQEDFSSSVQLERLFVPHEQDPRDEGEGYIYFFPGGRSQNAVIQMSNGEDQIYSVSIHPLTGRPEIYPYAYEPPDLDEAEEIRDPG